MSLCMGSALLQPAIRGKIADLLNYPVAHARVVLCGSKLGRKKSTLTGQEGTFLFSRVPPGIYTLEVNCTSYGRLVQRGIAVYDHAITGMDLKMSFLEDSRALKLQSLSLEYVNDSPATKDVEKPSWLTRQLHVAVDELRLSKTRFDPTRIFKVGRREFVEFGIYQKIKEEIIHRLFERKIDLFTSERLDVALTADLQASGCRVEPKSFPRVMIAGSRYVGWSWEVMPLFPGLGLICLSLDVEVKFSGRCELKKRLLFLDRETRISRNPWRELRDLLKNGRGNERRT